MPVIRRALLMGLLFGVTACGSAVPGAGSADYSSGQPTSGQPTSLPPVRIPPKPFQFGADSIVGFKSVPVGSVTTPTFLAEPLVQPQNYSSTLTAEFVSDVENTVILRYSDPKTYGTFWLVEAALPTAGYGQSDIVTLSKICTDCTETGLVPVSPNIDGALLAGPPATSVTWLQNGMWFRIIGPDDTLSAKAAETIASDVATAAGAPPQG